MSTVTPHEESFFQDRRRLFAGLCQDFTDKLGEIIRNPKHAFRLFFRDEYGDGQLDFPLFGDNGTKSFDGIDLRTFQNYSWSFGGDGRGVFVRDQFSRDVQLAMGEKVA